jgi:hypothetical protein
MQSSLNYFFSVIVILWLFTLSLVISEPKIIMYIQIVTLFLIIIFHQSIFNKDKYLIQIIFLSLLVRLSLYFQMMLNSEFEWKVGIGFFEEDTLSWFSRLIEYVLMSFNSGSIPNIFYLETFGASNGLFYSYVSGFFLFIVGSESFYDGAVYLPLLNFFFLSLSLYYFNKLVLIVSRSERVAIISVCLLAFSPQTFYWNFFIIKSSFLVLIVTLFSYNIARLILTKNNKYLLFSILYFVILFIDREYYGFFAAFVIFFTMVTLNYHGNLIQGFFRLKVVVFVILFILVFHSEIYTLYYRINGYMTHSTLISNTGIFQSIDLHDNSLTGLVRFLLTPLPFGVQVRSSVDLVLNFSFFVQFPLVILSFYGVQSLVKFGKPYIYILLPLLLMLLIFSSYSPGSARVRDGLFPLLVLVAGLRFYDMKDGIKKLFTR